MSLDYVTLTDEAIHSCAIEAREMNLVKLLSPRIFIDGSAWCVLYGDDLQNGVAGFGETPRLAVYAFNKAWDAELPRTSAEVGK